MHLAMVVSGVVLATAFVTAVGAYLLNKFNQS